MFSSHVAEKSAFGANPSNWYTFPCKMRDWRSGSAGALHAQGQRFKSVIAHQRESATLEGSPTLAVCDILHRSVPLSSLQVIITYIGKSAIQLARG